MHTMMLQGPYTGQVMLLEDADAVIAQTDGWGRPLEGVEYPYVEQDMVYDWTLPYPQSLIDWLDKIPGYNGWDDNADAGTVYDVAYCYQQNPAQFELAPAQDFSAFAPGASVIPNGTGWTCDGQTHTVTSVSVDRIFIDYDATAQPVAMPAGKTLTLLS